VSAHPAAHAAQLAYPPPPNPYNLQARLTGFVNQIYVQAMSQDQVQSAIHEASNTLVPSF
jgi:macrolide transport system ATP-binding/permease protein